MHMHTQYMYTFACNYTITCVHVYKTPTWLSMETWKICGQGSLYSFSLAEPLRPIEKMEAMWTEGMNSLLCAYIDACYIYIYKDMYRYIYILSYTYW